ncbi:MAG: hypothetical protein IPG50_20335 [Myxococcales bacterium]|nr:hypothetical protein [Myxococcales bacterium]
MECSGSRGPFVASSSARAANTWSRGTTSSSISAIGASLRSSAIPPWSRSRLSWTHYRALLAVSDPAARAFYEIEAERENWSTPHLERQIFMSPLRRREARHEPARTARAAEGCVPSFRTTEGPTGIAPPRGRRSPCERRTGRARATLSTGVPSHPTRARPHRYRWPVDRARRQTRTCHPRRRS